MPGDFLLAIFNKGNNMNNLIIKFIVMTSFVFIFCGCSAKQEHPVYEGKNSIGYGNMYRQVPDSNDFYTSDEMNYIQKDIASWAKANLLFDSSQMESVEAKAFISLIADEDERGAILSDCQETSSVQINSVDVVLKKAVRTKYQDKEMGKVNCTITLSGQRNGNELNRTYTMSLLIHYVDQQTAIYEIGKISFQDAGD